jgi:thiol-disulfide isomerase/thioredoxin
MKRVLVSIVSFFMVFTTTVSSHAGIISPGSVTHCNAIPVNPAIKKGTTLSCLDSKSRVVLEALRGPMVVNVFGSWCAPCQQEIPRLIALYASKKVTIVGVDVEESTMSAGRAFVMKKGITWPVLFDADGSTKANFGPGVPVTWFINSVGTVVYKKIGLIATQSELNLYVKKYLGITVKNP